MVRLRYLSLLAAGPVALGQSGGRVGSGSQVSSAATPIATSTLTNSNSNSNPLIPNSISTSCQSYLESLNGNQQLAACTSSLLSTISSFTPANTGSSFTQSASQVSAGLDSLCGQDGCDEAVVRAQLGQFYGNCSTELNAGTEVVVGQYDVLYVLVPMTEAVCAKDGAGGWCMEDIAKGVVPAATTSSAASASSSLVSESASGSGFGSAVAAVTGSTEGVASASDDATAASSAAVVDSQSAVASAVSSDSSAAVSAPVSAAAATATNAEVASVATTSAVADSSAAAVAAASAATSSSAVDPTYATPNVSSLVSTAPFSITSYIGSATSPQSLFALASSLSSSAARLARRASAALAPRSSTEATGVLPVASTWSAANVPFLFLSANMSSTVLCTTCTSAVMAPYISWESRMPYPLGLSNSPILGEQHVLWTGLGTTCGSGYLASITSKAGETNVSSGAAGRWAGSMGGVVVAGVVAVVALLA